MADRYRHDDDYVPEVLSREDIEVLRRRWPSLASYRIDRVASGFKWDRENPRPRAGDVHSYFDDLDRGASSLAALLNPASDDRRFSLHVAERASDFAFRAKEMASDLSKLSEALKRAKEYFPKGAPPFKFDQQHLFEGLAEIIRGAGLKTDRSEHGPLMTAVTMIFDALPFSDLPAPYNFVDKQLSLEKRSQNN